MGARSGPGRWEGSDSKRILKVKPVRFPDESERSIKEKAPGWPGLLHGNSGNDLAAGWEGGPGSEGLSEAPAPRQPHGAEARFTAASPDPRRFDSRFFGLTAGTKQHEFSRNRWSKAAPAPTGGGWRGAPRDAPHPRPPPPCVCRIAALSGLRVFFVRIPSRLLQGSLHLLLLLLAGRGEGRGLPRRQAAAPPQARGPRDEP